MKLKNKSLSFWLVEKLFKKRSNPLDKLQVKNYLIAFNGEIIGLYYGPDLDHIPIDWYVTYNEDPDPIQVIELEKLF